MAKPNTGNTDVDRWIVDTFRRSTHLSLVTGCNLQELTIRPIPNEIKLNEDQIRGLIRYLEQTFCMACGGTGFDPDDLEGRCEYCNKDLPF